MAVGKEIKNRIKSVKSTKKITKAMELVAASKMKRAVSATLASRLYAEYSWRVLTSIAKNIDEITHPLFVNPEIKNRKKNILLVLITSNRGLCGAYNTQVIKKTLQLFKNNQSNAEGLESVSDKGVMSEVSVVTVGKKGDNMMRRLGKKIVLSFTDLPDNPSLRDVSPISKYIIDEYTRGTYDEVLVAYTDYVSALTQKPNLKQILPIEKREIKDLIENLSQKEEKLNLNNSEKNIDYHFEGDMHTIIGLLAEKLTRMQIYQMMLESGASEQSARMIAMKNASDASSEMIDDLTLMFNKARQASITQEISEISAGMVSVN